MALLNLLLALFDYTKTIDVSASFDALILLSTSSLIPLSLCSIKSYIPKYFTFWDIYPLYSSLNQIFLMFHNRNYKLDTVSLKQLILNHLYSNSFLQLSNFQFTKKHLSNFQLRLSLVSVTKTILSRYHLQ